MAFSQIATSVTILNSGLIGYYGISLTNIETSALSVIAAGSSIEIAGAFFKADTDITPNASSWTAITTATNAYLGLTPSGTAGSQVLSAAYVSTPPVWSTSKQGWYTSAGSNIRVVASAYKNGATSALQKEYINKNEEQMNYRFKGEKVLLTATSGTFIVPANVYKLRVTCVGGGGGGGSGSNGVRCGGGGGGTIISPILAETLFVTPGQSLTYACGAGGTAGTGSLGTGGDGGSTSFQGATTRTGGIGGIADGGGAGANNAAGSAGASAGPFTGGCGGGAGGKGGAAPGNPTVGNYGGGGGGSNGGGGNGAAGGPGCIIVEY